MNIEQLRDLLNEYENNRTKNLGLLQRSRFFFTQKDDDRYMPLLQRFVDMKNAELLARYNDEKKVLEHDIPFNEFVDYLRNCNQLDSFESYLTTQPKLPYEGQGLAYKLIKDWVPKELPEEIWTRILMNLFPKNLQQTQLVCRYFKKIYDAITSRYPKIDCARNETLMHAIVHNEEALKSYNESLKRNPNDPIKLCNRGNALVRLGRYNEALESYNESLKIAPNNADTLHNKEVALNEQRYKEALKNPSLLMNRIVIDQRKMHDHTNRVIRLHEREIAEGIKISEWFKTLNL